MNYIPQYTLQYKTYVKRAMVEALRASFASHPDPTVSTTKVEIDYTEDDFVLPAVVIAFQEQQMPNAGVGHYEWLPSEDAPGEYVRYQHRMYKGNIVFEVWGMSSADRDLIGDALVEVLTMDEVSSPGQAFRNRIYNEFSTTPFGPWHLATLNFDLVDPQGEQAVLAPWSPEDQMVYKTGYSIGIFGEFYSYTPPEPETTSTISEVDLYPYNPIIQPPPPVPESDYIKITGTPPGQIALPEYDPLPTYPTTT